jgi:hypothetical protein
MSRHAAKATWLDVEPLPEEPWQWPFEANRYDRAIDLTDEERSELRRLVRRHEQRGHWPSRRFRLIRLRQPMLDALELTGGRDNAFNSMLSVLVLEMNHRQCSFWGWTPGDWAEVLCASGREFEHRYPVTSGGRQHLIAFAYLLNPELDLDKLGAFERVGMARKVFGPSRVNGAIRRVHEAVTSWGYSQSTARGLHLAVCEALLANRSPMLAELTADFLDKLRQRAYRKHLNEGLFVVSRALFGLGITDRPPLAAYAMSADRRRRDPTVGVAPEWTAFCQRWEDTSTLSPRVRHAYYLLQLKAGRWATHEHPDSAGPETWTRDVAIAYVAAVDGMTVGELTARTERLASQKLGKPLTPKAKMHHIAAMSAFFRDCQEWGWLPRRFDPRRCFAVPRSIRALVGPDPRVLADDIWAKLLWAGLNFTEDDLPRAFHSGHSYPMAMVRALAVVWLFAGLRSDEIRRMRVGCVRWHDEVGVAGTGGGGKKTCLLDVPVNKTGTAFTKPVDSVVGEAIAAWERVRPEQPNLVDRKTAQIVDFLFAFRGRRVGYSYLNGTLIPLLCRKAGVPTHDARGNITTHRARSTIATQLGNAKDPMLLLELQQWLGHRWPASTLSYIKVTPTRLAKAYADAGYFARNVRVVEVLIDQDAIKSGAAAAGDGWKFYDLGHGYCTYDFFDQCPHRMACAKCSFYRPKGSSGAMLLEGKANLLHMLQQIPLTEDERAAVEDGVSAFDGLLAKLADVPTPAGPTPRELGNGPARPATSDGGS